MFLLIGCGIIIVVTAVAIWRSKKPLNQILAEAKYELVYNALGSRAVLEDMVMKSKNKTGEHLHDLERRTSAVNSFPELPVLTGKVALITGGARGIGAEVVQMLLQCDVHVIIGTFVEACDFIICKNGNRLQERPGRRSGAAAVQGQGSGHGGHKCVQARHKSH